MTQAAPPEAQAQAQADVAEVVRWPWLAAARPQTLPVGIAPVLLATALAMRHGNIRLRVLLCALGGSIAIQIGTNLFNDWADAARGADGADRLGPMRVTSRGVLGARRVLGASIACFAVASVFGVQLVLLGGWLVVAVGLLSIAAGVLYTGGPYPLAYNGLGDVFAFVFFGPVPVVVTYMLHAGAAGAEVWAFGLCMGAFSAAVILVNNLRDRFSDARVNKRTLAVRLGARASRLQYAMLLACPYLLTAGCAAVAYGRGQPTWQLLPWLSAPLAIALVRQVHRRDGAALNPLLGATARLEMLFALFACVGALAAKVGGT